MKKFGASNWEEVAKWAQMERTSAQIKDRWKRLNSKKVRTFLCISLPSFFRTQAIQNPQQSLEN